MHVIAHCHHHGEHVSLVTASANELTFPEICDIRVLLAAVDTCISDICFLRLYRSLCSHRLSHDMFPSTLLETKE